MPRKKRTQRIAILLLAPSLILFIVFGIVPMLGAVYLSLVNWNGIGHQTFVGLSNWVQFVKDSSAWHSILLTFEVMILTWVIQTPLSLMVGIYLAGKQRHRSWMGVIYFLPLLFSSVAVGLLWSYILDPNFGLVNTLLNAIHLKFLAANWLGSTRPGLVLWTLVAIVSWQYIPFHSLLYQAGRKQIADSLYEAARIDGVTFWKEFWFITLPQLKYTVVTSTVLMLTGSLTFFDLIYILTDGGPNEETNVLAVNMYNTAFNKSMIGYGSVFAVVIAIIGIILSIVMTKFTGFRKLESQSEGV
ncbi:carbohydrate ABC transporter permease [Alicyclobacillus kakegawensis]|uniref:carbohydrate ABC transporter permease n=1 Tax=Alicyclobacillus kakegawensis TaxID=392012 RepID=UPI000B1FE440|nr:sugar ABC transporter permease [Alicyclobacillus kakegawensis]